MDSASPVCISCYDPEQAESDCVHESKNETFACPGLGPTPAPPSRAVDLAFSIMASAISQMADLPHTMGKAGAATLGSDNGNRSTLNAVHMLKIE